MSDFAPADASNTMGGGYTNAQGGSVEFPNELRNVDATGTPVESRMPSALAMRMMHDDFVRYDREAALARASISGLVNGAPPFDPQQLKNDGQAFRRNFNPRDAEAAIDPRCTADFNLVFDVAQSVEFSFRPGLFSDKNVEKKIANDMAVAYTDVFKRCPRVAEAAQRVIRDKNVLGLGFMINVDKFDWRPKGIIRGRVFFNPTASSDCTDLHELTCIDTMTLSECYRIVDGGQASVDAGWDLEALKTALASFWYSAKEVLDNYGGNYMLAWEDLERRRRAYDTQVLSRQHQVFPIVHGLIEERNGKVSHYIIAQNYPSETPEKFLFAAKESYDKMKHVVTPFPFDYGEGTLASVKGYGHRMYSLAAESAKSLMRTLDAVDLATSYILTNRGGDNLQFAMQRFGPVTLLSETLEPVQTSFTPNVTPAMEARELLSRIISTNTGIARVQMEDTSKRESMKTAEQVRYEGTREATYEKQRLFQAYMRWDAMHQENFRRMTDPKCNSLASPAESREAIDEFFEICESYGVPKKWIVTNRDKIRVSATRSLGAGSTYTKMNNLITAMNLGLLNYMTEQGRRELVMEVFSSLAGYDSIGRFFSIDGNDVPSNESTIAGLEANDHYEGTPTIVGVDQNHTAHVAVHLAVMMQEKQLFEQDPLSRDLERTVNLFQNSIPHVLRHIEILAGDPTRKQKVEEYAANVQQLTEFFNQVAPMFEAVQRQKAEEIEQLRKQNQELLQSMSKEQLAHEREMFKANGMLEIERMKTEALNESRFQKTQAQLQVQVEKAGQAMAIKQQQFTQEMNERMAKLQMDVAEAQAKIQATLAKTSAAQRGAE